MPLLFGQGVNKGTGSAVKSVARRKCRSIVGNLAVSCYEKADISGFSHVGML